MNNSALFREQRVSICSCTSLNHVVRIPCTELACLWKLGLQILYWACHTRDKHVKRTRHAGYLVHQELLQEIPHKVYNSYILHEHVPRSWILKSVRKLILVLNDKMLFLFWINHAQIRDRLSRYLYNCFNATLFTVSLLNHFYFIYLSLLCDFVNVGCTILNNFTKQ